MSYDGKKDDIAFKKYWKLKQMGPPLIWFKSEKVNSWNFKWTLMTLSMPFVWILKPKSNKLIALNQIVLIFTTFHQAMISVKNKLSISSTRIFLFNLMFIRDLVIKTTADLDNDETLTFSMPSFPQCQKIDVAEEGNFRIRKLLRHWGYR